MHQTGRFIHANGHPAHVRIHFSQVRQEMPQCIKIPHVSRGADFNLVTSIFAHIEVSEAGWEVFGRNRLCPEPSFQLFKGYHDILPQCLFQPPKAGYPNRMSLQLFNGGIQCIHIFPHKGKFPARPCNKQFFFQVFH